MTLMMQFLVSILWSKICVKSGVSISSSAPPLLRFLDYLKHLFFPTTAQFARSPFDISQVLYLLHKLFFLIDLLA